MARDYYSFLHFPMVSGVVLIALGMKTTIAHTDEPLTPETAFALVGGVVVYLLAHVAFRLRNVRSLNRQRTAVAGGLLVLIPFADRPDAIVTLAVVAAIMVALIAFEATRFSEARDQIRHQ
jgi:low temperature requirement protein LtrA